MAHTWRERSVEYEQGVAYISARTKNRLGIERPPEPGSELKLPALLYDRQSSSPQLARAGVAPRTTGINACNSMVIGISAVAVVFAGIIFLRNLICEAELRSASFE
jgi:hypothetical protein